MWKKTKIVKNADTYSIILWLPRDPVSAQQKQRRSSLTYFWDCFTIEKNNMQYKHKQSCILYSVQFWQTSEFLITKNKSF